MGLLGPDALINFVLFSGPEAISEDYTANSMTVDVLTATACSTAGAQYTGWGADCYRWKDSIATCKTPQGVLGGDYLADRRPGIWMEGRCELKHFIIIGCQRIFDHVAIRLRYLLDHSFFTG